MDNPFQLDVYDKGRNWLGRIGNPIAVDGSVKDNALGNFQIRIAADDVMADDILTNGCRVSMGYLPPTERRAQAALGQSPSYAPLMSGMVRTNQGSVLPNGDIVFQLQDDWRMLPNTVAWVNPLGTIKPTDMAATSPSSWGQAWLPGGDSDAGPDGTTQGQLGYYLWPDGSAGAGGILVQYAETAIKHLIKRNLLDRLGRPISIAVDQERGGDARAAGILPLIRMSKVDEALAPILAWSGLSLKLIQPFGSSLINVEVRVPSTWAAEMIVDSGIVQAGTWSSSAPTVTRTVVGGPGEDVNRAFETVVDATGLEAEYGDVIEVFRDATGAKLVWPSSVTTALQVAKYFTLRPEPASLDKTTFNNYLLAAGGKGLLEGRPTAAAQVTLSETESFYFGGADGIQLGDSATIKTSAGDLYTQRVTEAKFSLTRDKFTVEPILGTATDDPMQTLANAIATLAAAQRRVSANR